MLIFGIITLILGLLSLGGAIFWGIKTKRRNQIDLDAEKQAQMRNEALTRRETALKEEINQLNAALNLARANFENKPKAWESQAKESFSSYCDALERSYTQQEDNFDRNINALSINYANKKQELDIRLQSEQEKINIQLNQAQNELAKIRETRAAAIQAQLREEEIKKQLAFYCLQISKADLEDIKVLENIKERLNNPRILSMLIWSTYFQKSMTNLCNNVVGTNIVSGIYKITNQKNNLCYIGQSVNISDRFKQHAKCGLGIDTPQGNKLYAAMIQDGLWNFSFEVLEKCPKEQLNEKEKFYINLYQSKEFGYNTTKGNGD